MIRISEETAGRLLGGDLPDEKSLTSIREQLDNPNHANDLLDRMAKLLTHPSTKNNLNSGLLQSLREAILTPSEWATVATQFKMVQSCRSCGKRIEDAEVLVVIEGNQYCMNCYAPRYTSCGSCQAGSSALTGADSRRLLKFRSNGNCKVCGQKEAPPKQRKQPVEDEPAIIEEPEITFNQMTPQEREEANNEMRRAAEAIQQRPQETYTEMLNRLRAEVEADRRVRRMDADIWHTIGGGATTIPTAPPAGDTAVVQGAQLEVPMQYRPVQRAHIDPEAMIGDNGAPFEDEP